MVFRLPSLPYPLNSLAPHLPAETLEVHHGRLHRNYIDTLNSLVERADLGDMSLEELIRTQEGPIFECSAQAWNHDFYWHSMTPGGGRIRSSRIRTAIERDFGGSGALRESFKEAALSVFGSGWAWLFQEDSGHLGIMTTKDADCPIRVGKRPLIACDVWEHAYYLDYKNMRSSYLDAWWQTVNWSFAEDNLRREVTLL